jgi:hypothetical protein
VKVILCLQLTLVIDVVTNRRGEYLVDKLEKHLRRIFAPIIVYSGCEDLVTGKMKTRIQLERLTDFSDDSVSDYEAMVYVHTASVCVPFSGEWFDIYTYLFSKYHPEQAKAIGVYKQELSDIEQRELESLKKWIYRKQETHDIMDKYTHNRSSEFSPKQV